MGETVLPKVLSLVWGSRLFSNLLWDQRGEEMRKISHFVEDIKGLKTPQQREPRHYEKLYQFTEWTKDGG